MLNFTWNSKIQLKLKGDVISSPSVTESFKRLKTPNLGKDLKQQEL